MFCKFPMIPLRFSFLFAQVFGPFLILSKWCFSEFSYVNLLEQWSQEHLLSVGLLSDWQIFSISCSNFWPFVSPFFSPVAVQRTTLPRRQGCPEPDWKPSGSGDSFPLFLLHQEEKVRKIPSNSSQIFCVLVKLG